MTICVAAIKGRDIAAFYAENGAAAMVRVGDRLFRDDLMVLVQVRPAFPAEESRWPASRAKAIRHGNVERKTTPGSLSWLRSPISTAEEDDRIPAAAPI
jgi:hypothetical protein